VSCYSYLRVDFSVFFLIMYKIIYPLECYNDSLLLIIFIKLFLSLKRTIHPANMIDRTNVLVFATIKHLCLNIIMPAIAYQNFSSITLSLIVIL